MKNLAEIELLESRDEVLRSGEDDHLSGCAKKLVLEMLINGSRHYVDNVEAAFSLLLLDKQLLPLVIADQKKTSDPSRPSAAVVSPGSHYFFYTREEVGKRHPGTPDWLVTLAFRPLNILSKLGDLDEVVLVNNWLRTTNPIIRYTAPQLKAIIDCLTTRYPTAGIVFRGLMPKLHPEQFRLFQETGFRMVRYRTVYVVEDCRRACLESPELRRDLLLSRKHGYKVVQDPKVLYGAAERLAYLYRDLYLGKHSRLNLQFNAEFIRLTLREGMLTYRAFQRNDSIDAVKAWFVGDGMMTGVFVGYDRKKPRDRGLYRQAMALQTSEAARLGVRLHLSGGAGRFKMLRGAAPHEEYEAVWDRHLPLRRRLPWDMLAWAGRAKVALNEGEMSRENRRLREK